MLVIDDNMFRLAKMQESLLKATNMNREENLSNYIKTVAEIDSKAFADILEELKHIDDHNQSFEEEVQFLERIKSCYDQLWELQLGFKRVCELYGSQTLVLSDLSQVNIDYINSRINTINGYLINLKNIDDNKQKLQDLDKQLVVETKKSEVLSSRLLQLEEELRSNFVNAEGRCIVNDKLQYTSVVSEYKELGLDFEKLLADTNALDKLVSSSEEERRDIEDKLNTAQICYNNSPSVESRQILSEINIDALKVKYRLTLLKILKLLSQNYESYDQVREKREKLLDLIKYRVSCLSGLGMRLSIDPFGRTKVSEQLNTILSMPDNSKVINGIRKKIDELVTRNEEMKKQNSEYLLILNNPQPLFESKVKMSDVDVSTVELPFEDILMGQVREILPNQVVGIRSFSDKFNMNIVSQKTASVIKRVSQMTNDTSDRRVQRNDTVVPELVIVPQSHNVVEDKVANEDKDIELFVPSLTILSEGLTSDDKKTSLISEEASLFDDQNSIEEVFVPSLDGDDPDLIVSFENDGATARDESDKNVSLGTSSIEEVSGEETQLNYNGDTTDLFSTVDPFTEPLLFNDRSDQSLMNESSSISTSLNAITDEQDEGLDFPYSDTEEMPEVFWSIEEDSTQEVDEEELSFDDQIDVLLATGNDAKKVDSKKLVLNKQKAA